MKLFNRKSKFERMVENLESNEVLKSAARKAVEAAVAGAASPRQAEKVHQAMDSFDFGKPAKPPGIVKKTAKRGLIMVAGVAALTAASASVSSLRHRESSS